MPATHSQTCSHSAAIRALSTPSSSRNRTPETVPGITPDPTSLLTATTCRRVARQASSSPSTRSASCLSASGAPSQSPHSSITPASHVDKQSTNTGVAREAEASGRESDRRVSGPAGVASAHDRVIRPDSPGAGPAISKSRGARPSSTTSRSRVSIVVQCAGRRSWCSRTRSAQSESSTEGSGPQAT
jgi:hypothetical protein